MGKRSQLIAHLIKEGWKGLAISPGQTAASVLSLAVAGSLLVLSVTFGSVAVSALDRAGQDTKVLVYLVEDIPAGRIESLLKDIGARPNVETIEYLSREQDRARNRDLLPQDIHDCLPDDAIPAQHCLEISFRTVQGRAPDMAAISRFIDSLEGIDIVAEPPVGSDRIRALAAAVGAGRVILWILAVALLFGTIFFVVGTLSRTMEKRQNEMAILRLLGATDAFLKTPLYIQGIVQGIVGLGIGAASAWFVTVATNSYLQTELAVSITIPTSLSLSVGSAVLFGTAVGSLAAFIASLRRLP